MSDIKGLVANAVRRIETMFPGFFPEAKHDFYKDFGFPPTLSFAQLYGKYRRNGIARAGVDKTILKTWQDNPWLLEKERDGSEKGKADETKLEAEIRKRFDDLRMWAKIAETDRRSLVGNYAGLILRLADNKRFDQPVATVPGGLDGLVEVIPAWEGQLTVAEWVEDQDSPEYGQPKMFQFNEAAVGKESGKRQMMIHPDRVIVWSRDGTIYGESILEAGFNDLINMEKVAGAGGEGFWKNAKSSPILEVDKDARIQKVAADMGVPPDQVVEKMNEQVEDWQKGFDKLLMLQGMEAKTLGVTLPSPEHFFAISLQGFAASIPIPLKILVGSQTGERASTEDAAEWAQTNNARRVNIVIPNIRMLIKRLVKFRVLPEADWFVDWTDLTETSIEAKIDRAVKMSTVNQNMRDSGELVFTGEEIRETVDLEPLSDDEKYRSDDLNDAEDAVTTPPLEEKKNA